MSPKKRRTPRKHTVHTRDPRYNVNQYGRGTDPPYMQRMRRLHLKTVDDTMFRKVYHDNEGAYINAIDGQGNEYKLRVRELDKIAKGNLFQVPSGHPQGFISHRDPTKYPANKEIRSMSLSNFESYKKELDDRHQDLHFKNREIESVLRSTTHNLPRDQYTEIRRQMAKNNREMAEIRSVTQFMAKLEQEKAWKSAKAPSIRADVFRLRSTHGHYGGTYVDVPAEEYPAFRKNFDEKAFPRGENIRRRIYGEQAYITVFFADQTKAIKRLETLEDKKKVKLVYQ